MKIWLAARAVLKEESFSFFLRQQVLLAELIAGFALSYLLVLHPGGVGDSQKNWVGVCGPLPKTLTLFMTKICDFPYNYL